MDTITTVDELLTRAFELAYFILGDRTIAIYVAMSAVDKLKIASNAQDRRFDYRPVGRFTHPAIRTKVTLSEPHLLQRLIYAESEPFERLLEGQRRSVQEDMIIRFIKHLVRITIKHNSFYVSLGLCRLLHNYTTTETAEIYDFLIQDPDRTKDDYYYRSRKQHLMREMKERFGQAVQTYRGQRGEERFQAQEDSAKYRSLVEECFRRFTPWQSDCVLPEVFDHHRNVIAPLLFEGANPDEEHQIELNRIHTILHPLCFGRVTDSLGLDVPSDRLEIPLFYGYGDDQRSPADRFRPAALSEDEVDAVKRYLERFQVSRKAISGDILSLLIDGCEWARFKMDDATEIQFEVPERAESIGVSSFESDEAIPLAIHMLAHGESGILPTAFSVMTKGAASLGVRVQVQKEISGETSCTVVGIDHRNVESIDARSWVRRIFRLRNNNEIASTRWMGASLLRLGLAVLLVIISFVSMLIYFRSRERSNSSTMVAKREQPEQHVSPPTVPPVVNPRAEDRPEPQGNIRERDVQHSTKSVASNTNKATESTRRAEWVTDPTELLTVKRVFVDGLGDSLMSRQVRDSVITQLRSSNRFVVVESRDEADAVFKGIARATAGKPEKAALSLRLVNADGKVVWPIARATASRRYTGTAGEISDYVLKTLLNDIARLEQAR